LEQQYLENIAGLDSWLVQGFVNSLAIYEIPTIYHTTCVLRRALRYLYDQGITATDLSTVVPKIRYCKKAKIPCAYSKDEIERMVSSIDRGSPRGKRDYALILLAARLGLRASDIANLTFSSFKWDKNIIEVAQQKTGEPVTLPLLNDIGEAVIDYIRYARPKSDVPFLFLKLNAPNDVMYANSIHHTVYARLKEAGIRIPPGKKHGPHALRHSLASALLEHNVPMPVISEALGHTDTESTSVYLKIDVARLRECAVEVSAFCGGHESQFGGAR
jgi:integrase